MLKRLSGALLLLLALPAFLTSCKSARSEVKCPECNVNTIFSRKLKVGDTVRCVGCNRSLSIQTVVEKNPEPQRPARAPQTETANLPPAQPTPLLVDQLAPRDPVTNRRTPNIVSLADEIASCEKQTQDALNSWASKGIPVDSDAPVVEKLREMLTRLTKVSHTPNYPWRVHLIHQSTNNAFTIGGGKVFVFAGLMGPDGIVQNDLELAAVLAHEIAHVACRHVPEAITWTRFGSFMSDRISGQRYKACYSTDNEDEADRVGVLYMALAGYDPSAMPKMWARAHRKEGSNPGTYMFDHSLPIDRARKTEWSAQLAAKYYLKAGAANPDASRILLKNDLISREELPFEDNELTALVSAAGNTYLEHLKTRKDEESRERASREKATADQRQQPSEEAAALRIAMAIKGFKEYRCYRCTKVVWAKPGSRVGCPHCNVVLVIPR
jgi:predicted Zn-dependent protease/ribosomal protein S27E